MVVEEYQLVSTAPAMAPPVFTSSVITTATEVHERQRRKSAALEESWKQDDAVRPAGFTAAQFDVVKN